MNLNIHRVESVKIDAIEPIEHDDGRVVYIRRITITNHQGSFEVNMFAKQSENLNLKEEA